MDSGEQLELLARLLAALLLGGLVGLQREYRGHEAGIRTSALVCAGAATFGAISLQFTDDARIAAAVVQGIGFIGAGLIFQQGTGFQGVTTAASVWVLAGIGLMAALDLWLVAVLFTGAVIVLLELAPVSDWVFEAGRRRRRGRPGRRQGPPPSRGSGDREG